MTSPTRIAVVTGANRGIGFETVRQLAGQGITVILGSRDPANAEQAAAELRSEGLDVVDHALDVTEKASVERLAGFIAERFGRLDILVNNAGIMLRDTDSPLLDGASLDTIRATLETNVYGPVTLAQALVPLMKGKGSIVNVSSGMGQLSDMGAGYTAYRLSKTALNALTRMLAAELGGTQIKVNSACPGWVRTDMGGSDAVRTVAQGAETVVWLATLGNDGPSGGFFRDKHAIPW
ncbi:MAG: SDR family oxidoreductase [Gammaproteobacteria bacterium]